MDSQSHLRLRGTAVVHDVVFVATKLLAFIMVSILVKAVR